MTNIVEWLVVAASDLAPAVHEVGNGVWNFGIDGVGLFGSKPVML